MRKYTEVERNPFVLWMASIDYCCSDSNWGAPGAPGYKCKRTN